MTLHKSEVKSMSPRALKKSVAGAASQRPFTAYPAVIALLSAAYGLLIDMNGLAVIGMIAGTALSSGSWLWEYFVRGKAHASAAIQHYREGLEQKRRAALEQLQKDLQAVNDQAGLKQMSLFERKFRNFGDILSRKLEPDELTYQRYRTIAEQVFLGGLDNLERAALALKSVSAVDTDHIQSQLASLEDPLSARAQELRARLELLQSQQIRAEQLRLENEKALTQLDLVAAQLADIKTHQGRARLELDRAMEELQRLIIRTQDYSN